ncbi:putative isoamyl alcohol oxidase [Xylogone sp. PMI_703]|nr:putative isoamyl alcohol oxidase [Xylogone sp. PMI_703]
MAFSTVLLLLTAIWPTACHPALSSVKSLDAFNSSVHGRLRVNVPFELPFVEPDAAACLAVQQNYASPTFPMENPYMNSQDSICSSDPSDQCILDSTGPADTLAFTGQNCRQGNIPSHYLEVTDAQDVQAVFSFARSSGTPVVIKNSGHDYLSHSSQKGALALWTRNLRKLEYHDAFRTAITTGAGVNCDEAYRFADKNNVTILCAYSETVGISGGWVQTAGHSVLSPVYGLGVDRVLEFRVVTPDGQDLIANACQNQDLFWALRGGGGGTFGVVMESTHLVELRISMAVANIAFTSNSTTLLEWMGIMVEEAVPWADDGWGGHITGSSLIYVNPTLSMSAAQTSMKKAADYAMSHGGSAVFKHVDSFYDFYEEYIITNTVAVGNAHIAGSRLIPRSVLDNEGGRKALMDFLEDIITAGNSPYVPVSMPTVYKPDGHNTTSTTPATLDQRLTAVEALNNRTAQLEAITPGGGAYMNEANPFTSNWQESWWGKENYASLLTIKNRYDPDRLLRC